MSKPYTNAAAVADALNVASGALALAHSLAQQHGIELVSRIEEVSHAVSAIYDDADRMHRDAALVAHLLPRLRDAIANGGVEMSPLTPGVGILRVPKSEAEQRMPTDVLKTLISIHGSYEPLVTRIKEATIGPVGSYRPLGESEKKMCRYLVNQGVIEHETMHSYRIAAAFKEWV